MLALITEGGGMPLRILSEVGVNISELREELVNSLDVPDAEREMYLRQRNAHEAAQRSRGKPRPGHGPS
jgi:hypothetical protein